MFIGCGLMPRLVAMRPAGYGLDTVLKSLSQCASPIYRGALSEQFDPLQPRQLQRSALRSWSIRSCVRAKRPPPRIFPPFSSSPAVWSH